MLLPLSDQKIIVDSISTNFALSTIDDETHPDLYIHVEDEEAKAFLWELLKSKQDRYDEFVKRISVTAVGSCSVVDSLNTLASKLPHKSISVVDGDKKVDYPNCLSLPGTHAPEKMVFQDLKNLNWNNLSSRFGVGAGSLHKILNDAMLEPDHHTWNEYVGNHIQLSKDAVWSILISEWQKQVYPTLNDTALVDSICNKLDQIN